MRALSSRAGHNREARLQAWQLVAHVALVGACHRRAPRYVLVLVQGNPTRGRLVRVLFLLVPVGHQLVPVPRVAPPQHRIRHVVGVRLPLGHLEPGAGRLGAGRKARVHLGPEHRQSGARGRAHHKVARGVGVDDVGGGAAVGDVALDDVARHGLLPQDAQRRVCRDEGVQGVDAQPRVGGGVGLAAKVLDAEAGVGGGTDEGGVGGDARVGEQADVGLVVAVGAGFDELDLAAAAFLGGGAVEDDFAATARAVLLQDVGGRKGAGQRGACDKVVAAGMADADEGVELNVEGDHGALVAGIVDSDPSRC